MNERIGKLISEAIKAIPDHVDFDLPKEFTEKFAELIVRECASHLNWVGDDAAGIDRLDWDGCNNCRFFQIESDC